MGVEPDTAQDNIAPDAITVTDANQETEKAKICPSCNYSDDESEFETCPKCGLVIRKYYNRKRQEPPQPSTKNKTRAGVVIACAIMIVVMLLLFIQLNPFASPPVDSQKNEPSNPAASATSQHSAIAVNSPAETHSENASLPSDGLPDATANTPGIDKVKIAFASAVDNSNKPLNEVSRISISEKRIFSHIKMVIPPEKTYQFTGRLYDGDGKLVLNTTSPYHPKVAVSYAWYYHDIDRTVDKPGTWKFAFEVNGEVVGEQHIEVTDP